jgi:uncharacterized membrane protein YfcA
LGFIGLGGAEFRLPLLIAIFSRHPHRAFPINLLIGMAPLVLAHLPHEIMGHARRRQDRLPGAAREVGLILCSSALERAALL